MGSSAKTILANIPAREWRGLVPEWSGGRLRIPLKCSICGTEDHWSATRVINPNTAIPKIIQLGWQVGGKLLCPICVVAHRRRAPEPNMKLVEKITMTGQNNVAKLETPKLLEEQKKNKRLAILALEDYYDEAACCYREGKSDKAVADELGLSSGFVANVREEFYGKLAEPEEIGELRGEITAARKIVDDLEAKLTGLCNRNGWKV